MCIDVCARENKLYINNIKLCYDSAREKKKRNMHDLVNKIDYITFGYRSKVQFHVTMCDDFSH